MLTLSIYDVPLETALAIGLTLHLVVVVPLIISTAARLASFSAESRERTWPLITMDSVIVPAYQAAAVLPSLSGRAAAARRSIGRSMRSSSSTTAPRDGTADVAEQALRGFPAAQVIRAAHGGPARARNLGAWLGTGRSAVVHRCRLRACAGLDRTLRTGICRTVDQRRQGHVSHAAALAHRALRAAGISGALRSHAPPRHDRFRRHLFGGLSARSLRRKWRL